MIRKLCLSFIAIMICATGIGLAMSPAVFADPPNPVNVLPDQVCNNPDRAANTDVQICKDNQSTSPTNPLIGPGGLLTTVVNILSIVVGIAAIIVIIIAGLRTVISAGDAQSVASARKALIYALVGLVIAAAAQAIVEFVLNKV
jgi:hypothetical protein